MFFPGRGLIAGGAAVAVVSVVVMVYVMSLRGQVATLEAALATERETRALAIAEASTAAREAQASASQETIRQLEEQRDALLQGLDREIAQKEREKAAKWAARRKLDEIKRNEVDTVWLSTVPPVGSQQWLLEVTGGEDGGGAGGGGEGRVPDTVFPEPLAGPS